MRCAIYFARNLKFENLKMAETRRKKRRKQRDSTDSVKPPLDFIESPVEGRRYYCTPVQGARRPWLAPTMPVDDETSAKWVSPQFLRYTESSENLLTLNGPSKRQKSRGKRKENIQSDPRYSSNKQPLGALEFNSGKQNSRLKDINSNIDRPTRQSQRIRLKELKRTHFLFQASKGTTPNNKEGEIVFAHETPDQELLMVAKRRQLGNCTGKAKNN